MDEGGAGFDDELGFGFGDAAGFLDFVDGFEVGGVGFRGEVAEDVAAFAVVKFVTRVSGLESVEGVDLGWTIATAGKGGGDEFGSDGGEVGFSIIET